MAVKVLAELPVWMVVARRLPPLVRLRVALLVRWSVDATGFTKLSAAMVMVPMPAVPPLATLKRAVTAMV